MNLAEFQAVADEGWRRVSDTPGYLAEREARFLMLAAAGAPADGAIIEIGSFKGRSTVGLAYVAQRYELGKVVAIDPHTAPSTTDPELGAQRSSYDEFQENVRRAGVVDAVDCRRAFSHQVARDWTRPLRLLWIDGDHVYESVKQDLALFRRHLAPGAIVARRLLQVDRLGAVPADGRTRLAIPLASAAPRRGRAPSHSGGAGGLGDERARLVAPQAVVAPAAAWPGRSRPLGRTGGDRVAAPDPALDRASPSCA